MKPVTDPSLGPGAALCGRSDEEVCGSGGAGGAGDTGWGRGPGGNQAPDGDTLTGGTSTSLGYLSEEQG